jgi:hypothetical protein
MWEPWRLTIILASTVCYRDSVIFSFIVVYVSNLNRIKMAFTSLPMRRPVYSWSECDCWCWVWCYFSPGLSCALFSHSPVLCLSFPSPFFPVLFTFSSCSTFIAPPGICLHGVAINPLKTKFLLHNTYMQMQFLPHRKHITSPLQRPAGKCCMGKQSIFFCENRTEHRNTLCGQNAEF